MSSGNAALCIFLLVPSLYTIAYMPSNTAFRVLLGFVLLELTNAAIRTSSDAARVSITDCFVFSCSSHISISSKKEHNQTCTSSNAHIEFTGGNSRTLVKVLY